MKKINLCLFALLLVFAACSHDDEQLFDKQKNPTAPVLSLEGTTEFTLSEEYSDFYYAVLSWNDAFFGKGYTAGNTVEISNLETFDGDNISLNVEAGATLYPLTAKYIHELAVDKYGTLNEETGEKDPANLYFRIKAVEVSPAGVVNEQKVVYSNVESMDVKQQEAEIPEELTIHFKPITSNWTEYAVYAWGDAEVYGGWPGEVLTPTPDGWYTIIIPSNRPINLILNNNNNDNNKQFDFLKDPTISTCYEMVINDNDATWEEVECPVFEDELFMIGQDFGAWDWGSDGVAKMTPVHGNEGHYWAVRYITAGNGFKWNTKREWGGDFESLGEDIGFTTSGGNAVVDADGMYMVYVDMPNGKISVEPAKVYGMGDCFGGWDTRKFAFEVEDKTMTYTAAGTGELRIYAASDISPVGDDWWRMEFVVLDGKIVYRGGGDDQERVTVETGKKVILDFNAGTGSFE